MTATARYTAGAYEVTANNRTIRLSGMLQVYDYCRDNRYRLVWEV